MKPVSLAELLGVQGVRRILGERDTRVSSVVADSRRATEGALFVAVAGGAANGADFAQQAIHNGAVAVASEHPLTLGVPVLLVDNVRARLGPLSHRVFGEPTRALKTVAITGTNGKTTVTHLVESVLTHVGARPALLGTVAQRGPAYAQDANLTTPEADVIARFAHDQRAAGATHLLMEASSHALTQDRLRGCDVEVAGFTNLTQDHLDYHGDMAAYGEAKARLFTEYGARTSVIAVDYPFGVALSRRATGTVLRASLRPDADAELRVKSHASTREGIVALFETPRGELSLQSPLFGAHNVENLLVTVGVCLSLGVELTDLAEALRHATGAPGRMERVPSESDLMVLVDYAHTPDAIERALLAVRPMTRGRLYVVCGCGGDRDRSKRAPMGEAAVRGADIAVLTSDNPRTEDPRAILAEMVRGAEGSARAFTPDALATEEHGYTVIPDRAEAIRAAVRVARAGDSILIAGKGHETYQIVGHDKRPFDDRTEASAALRLRGDA